MWQLWLIIITGTSASTGADADAGALVFKIPTTAADDNDDDDDDGCSGGGSGGGVSMPPGSGQYQLDNVCFIRHRRISLKQAQHRQVTFYFSLIIFFKHEA